MNLPEYARLLRRRIALIVIVTAIGLGGAVAYCVIKTPEYVATSDSYVFVGGSTSVSDLSSASDFSQRIATSLSRIARTPLVLDQVVRDGGYTGSPTRFASKVDVSADSDSLILSISVRDEVPARAARYANLISQRLGVVAGQLTPDQSGTSVSLTTVQPATAPTQPVDPRPIPLIPLGALGGLLVGVLLAVLVESLDNRLRDPASVESITELPLIAQVPLDAQLRRGAETPVSEPTAEAFRFLRTNLRYVGLTGQDHGRTTLITSSIAGEGKSTTAVNLAQSLAQAGDRVLLIDGDLRRRRLAERLGLSNGVGLSDVLVGTVPVDDAKQRWGHGALEVLPGGPQPPNPSELLQSDRLTDLLTWARTRYDAIVIDAPPVLPVTDAIALSSAVDGVLFVVSARDSRRSLSTAALRLLQQVDAPIKGVVLTKTPPRAHAVYAYS